MTPAGHETPQQRRRRAVQPPEVPQDTPRPVATAEEPPAMDTTPQAEEWSDSSESSEESTTPSTSQTRRARPLGSMPLVPRTEMVDDKLRQKIRLGEFVDFKLLLPRPGGQQPKKRFTLSEGFFEEVEDESKILFYEWLDAFVVFMSVTLEFFPADAQGMLRHLQIVKKMQAAGKDAVEYDTQFRRLKSQNPDIVWGEYLTELANEITSQRVIRKPPKFNIPPQSQPRPKICFKFNSVGGCKYGMSCRFPHRCQRCSSFEHPQHRCAKLPRTV